MLKIGITGIGFMGMIHYLAYRSVSDVRVAAICEKIPERLAGDWTKIKGNFGPQGTQMDLSGVATYGEYEKMLADPDVDLVDICLPPAMHADAAVQALEAGKHVFCEKPISLTLTDADRMLAAARANGKSFHVGHVLPFFPSHAFAYEAVRSGRYGKLLGGHFNRVISDPTWLTDFYDMNKIGGPLLDLHIHDAHFIRLLFGMPDAVQSVGRLRGQTPEYFNTHFLFPDRELVVSATSGCIMQQGRPFTHGYEIHFERATLLCESFSGVAPTVLTEDGQVEKPALPELDEIGIFSNEMTEATQAVLRGQPSAILDGVLARDALSLCLAEMQSVQTRERVLLQV